MKNIRFCLIFAFNLLIFSANAQNTIEEISKIYSADTRCHIFELKESFENDVRTLKGKTNLPEVFEQISKIADSQNVRNELTLLPDKELGDEIYGIITISTAFVRSNPDYRSELLTQALLGTPVKIWEKFDGWLRIQTPDGYIGWTTKTSLRQHTQQQQNAWLGAEKVIFTSFYGQSYAFPDKNGDVVSDLVVGAMLKFVDETADFYQVQYPDGRMAFVEKSQCERLTDWLKNLQATPENIVKTAKRFIGIPYMWGGCSAKSTDCSGFAKMVYYLHNIILPRDASQQVRIGKSIGFFDDYSQLQKGDLLFFSGNKKRITHVGIYIGNQQFIHASGTVHLNSFDKTSPLYVERYVVQLQAVKRILGEVDETMLNNEFYLPKK